MQVNYYGESLYSKGVLILWEKKSSRSYYFTAKSDWEVRFQKSTHLPLRQSAHFERVATRDLTVNKQFV